MCWICNVRVQQLAFEDREAEPGSAVATPIGRAPPGIVRTDANNTPADERPSSDGAPSAPTENVANP